MKNNGTALTVPDTTNKEREEDKELRELWKELGISPKDGTALASHLNKNSSDRGRKIHPLLALGLGAGVLFNIGILLSLPPVLRGRGRF
jgi:hypothetical protein